MARTDMFNRIAEALPEDAEVQEFCTKQLAGTKKSQEKADIIEAAVLEILGKLGPSTSTEVARFAAQNGYPLAPGQNGWSSNSVGYYARKLVDGGKLTAEKPVVGVNSKGKEKTGPKVFSLV